MTRTLPQSFVGGELSPRMFGRPDDPKYQRGLARCRGFLIEPSGAARAGPGTEFVGAARNAAKRARLIPYRASGGETLQLELGFRQEYPATSQVPGYLRIHLRGATLLHSAAWSAATAYEADQLVTSAGVLYRAKQASTNQAPPNATYWESLEYVGQQDFLPAAVSFATDELNIPGHGLSDGEPIEFTNPLILPTYQIGSDVISIGAAVMYAKVVSSSVIQLATTPGGPAVDIITGGNGTHHLHRRYTAGNLVSRSGSVYYCRTTRPIDGSGVSILPETEDPVYWYKQPATGEYELPTTLAITEDELFAMTYSQQATVLTLAAPRSYPCELQPAADPHGFDVYTIWRWLQVAFQPPLPAPTGLTATATKRGKTVTIASLQGVGTGGTRLSINTTVEHQFVPGVDYVFIESSAEPALNDKFWGVEAGLNSRNFVPVNPDTGGYVTLGTTTGAGTIRLTTLNSDADHSYVVTTVDADGRESQQSAVATVTNNLFVAGAYNTITWAAVAGAASYRVYRQRADTGLYAWLGDAVAPTFRDDGTIDPDLGQTPPRLDDTLLSAPNHTTSATSGLTALPRAVAHHDGRRFFGGTDDDSQGVWGTRSNSESDLSYSIPLKATDRIHQRIKGTRAGTIRHLVSLGRLHVLTDTTEFAVVPVDTESLTPDSFAARAQSYVGAAAVQPELFGTVLLFVGARGGHLYEMAFTTEGGGYVPVDLCERAVHLFDGLSLSQLTSQTSPLPIAWGVSSSGLLLGVTRVPRQEVLAWHARGTDGVFESISSGLEDGEDRLYAIVRRTIDGQVVRYIERFAPLAPAALQDSWQVDCGLRLETAAAVSTVSVPHLEGKEVAILANGLVQSRQTVSGGIVTLETPLPAGDNKVLVGLPNTAELQTVPATFAFEAYGAGRPKNVSKVWVRVEASGSFEVGISLDNMLRIEVPPGQTFSGEVEMRVPAGWTADGQVYLRQADPLPLTVVAITADIEVAG